MEAELLRAKALAAEGRLEEAEKLIRYIPTSEALATLGLWQQVSGRIDEAKANLEKSLALNPDQAAAYYYLGQIHRFTGEDLPRVEQMERLTESPALTPAEQQLLCYAAGKAREEMEQYAEAMVHYDRANEFLIEGRPPFDPSPFVAGYDRIMELFPGPLETSGPDDELPVFIVGMIRSGTTLLEQILSSHPKVKAGGELPFWIQNAGRAINFATGDVDRPSLTALANEYVQMLRGLYPAAVRVTDKMPANASLLGLIHMALPKARIIHIRRHPIDNCLSIYTTRFENPPPYAGDKANIALAYRQNARIMRHWRTLIPGLLTIEYEELIGNREWVARRLIAFCGLKWDDACLHHERNQNTVQTPSLWRVRQPVDSSSVRRWERFRPWLTEFEGL